MGRIIRVVLNERGFLKSVTVKTKASELIRLITKVCLLVEAMWHVFFDYTTVC